MSTGFRRGLECIACAVIFFEADPLARSKIRGSKLKILFSNSCLMFGNLLDQR